MFRCKLVTPSLNSVASNVILYAKPDQGEYIQHEGILYYVHGCVLYTDDPKLAMLVKVTEA
jgi:hypothetical protein